MIFCRKNHLLSPSQLRIWGLTIRWDNWTGPLRQKTEFTIQKRQNIYPLLMVVVKTVPSASRRFCASWATCSSGFTPALYHQNQNHLGDHLDDLVWQAPGRQLGWTLHALVRAYSQASLPPCKPWMMNVYWGKWNIPCFDHSFLQHSNIPERKLHWTCKLFSANSNFKQSI